VLEVRNANHPKTGVIQAVTSRWDNAAGTATAAQFCDDADNADALAIGAEHGIVVHDAPLRLELGRLGVEPEHNLLAAHELLRAPTCRASTPRLARPIVSSSPGTWRP
jgi:hypothetical protein